MEGIFGTLVVVGMIVLRLILPVGITFGLAYLLHRLDTKWHPEATSAV